MISQNLFLLLVGGGCILSISPCSPLHTYPHRVVNGPYFEAGTRPQPEIANPNPIFIFETRFRPESQIYRGSSDMHYCVVIENVVCSSDSRMEKLGRSYRDNEKVGGPT